MAEAIIGTAALGAGVGEIFALLYGAVKDVTTKTLTCKTDLRRLKSTLGRLEPLVEDIRRSNRELFRPEEETECLIEQMKEGEKCVREISELSSWKYHLMRFYYGRKLCQLEEAIVRFFQVDMQAWNMRNVLQALSGVNEMRAQINFVVRNGGLSCAALGLLDSGFGLDEPLKELKMHLLKKDVSVLVLSSPGGCRMTPLLRMLCQDKDIKDLFQENIFFVPVSQTPNLKAIVHEVFHHKGDQVPEFRSEEEAINQLEQLLSQIGEPTLLILDDVWSGSESQLLERFEFPTPNYKILVTSGSTLPRFSFTYKLKPSYNVHAMALFRHSTTLQDGSSLVPDEEIVDKAFRNRPTEFSDVLSSVQEIDISYGTRIAS